MSLRRCNEEVPLSPGEFEGMLLQGLECSWPLLQGRT